MSEHDEGRSARCTEEFYANGLRNRYYLGKRMTPAAFQTEQAYQIERRRLINRSLHGWGVVEGYAVHPKDGKLWIGAGVALDQFGRELVQVDSWTLTAEALLPADDIALAKANPGQRYLLSVHFDERREQRVTLSDPCHCNREEWEYAHEMVGYTLTMLPGGDGELPSASRPLRACPSDSVRPAFAGDRGPYARLCEALRKHVTKAAPSPRPGRDVAGYKDVPLAWVTLNLHNDRLAFDEVDACGPRKLIIGNEMLYDLIRGRDLTHIVDLSWATSPGNPAPMNWDTFADLFKEVEPPNGGWTDAQMADQSATDGRAPDECKTGFTITFSAPVQPSTLADSFTMTVFIGEDTGRWGIPMRVPLTAPSHNAKKNRTSLCVRREWIKAQITAPSSDLLCKILRVEIEVRGDFILDSCGQAIDANAIARNPTRSGNGSPGGTFLSTFRVAARGSNHSTAS